MYHTSSVEYWFLNGSPDDPPYHPLGQYKCLYPYNLTSVQWYALHAFDFTSSFLSKTYSGDGPYPPIPVFLPYPSRIPSILDTKSLQWSWPTKSPWIDPLHLKEMSTQTSLSLQQRRLYSLPDSKYSRSCFLLKDNATNDTSHSQSHPKHT